MSDSIQSVHVPVLLDEVLAGLALTAGLIVVDGTLGGGGHTRRLAEAVRPGGRVIALDRDPAAVERAVAAWPSDPVVMPLQASFADLPEVLASLQIAEVDRVLLDLGLSSDQLADGQRGFAFSSDGPLDLRFDPGRPEPAWRLLERLSEQHLADLIFQLGEERFSRRIARRIVQRRQQRQPVRTAADLSQLVQGAVPAKSRHRSRIHPATRTFQALRIAVNGELDALEAALRRIPEVLRPGGRLAVISFHSLEDRRVKQAFRDDERYKVLTRKPIRPNESETLANPRSRSARLRIAERTAAP